MPETPDPAPAALSMENLIRLLKKKELLINDLQRINDEKMNLIVDLELRIEALQKQQSK